MLEMCGSFFVFSLFFLFFGGVGKGGSSLSRVRRKLRGKCLAGMRIYVHEYDSE